ncbi:hypothetical protein AO069_06500 [Pseudomonas syringae pv. syringae PD2774]|uniref:hypothetical protein n=1 Tax=Pseudomonas syringae TaxID=317 RepID=UPI0007376699|nr:hypothetical protein [Pseudomonas syringae]KTB88288.1 hypothetical protein AO069_06500 [Pseudomonas syringae pv. syringae PD2774]
MRKNIFSGLQARSSFDVMDGKTEVNPPIMNRKKSNVHLETSSAQGSYTGVLQVSCRGSGTAQDAGEFRDRFQEKHLLLLMMPLPPYLSSIGSSGRLHSNRTEAHPHFPSLALPQSSVPAGGDLSDFGVNRTGHPEVEASQAITQFLAVLGSKKAGDTAHAVLLVDRFSYVFQNFEPQRSAKAETVGLLANFRLPGPKDVQHVLGLKKAVF